jgi:hypothetical protein
LTDPRNPQWSESIGRCLVEKIVLHPQVLEAVVTKGNAFEQKQQQICAKQKAWYKEFHAVKSARRFSSLIGSGYVPNP